MVPAKSTQLSKLKFQRFEVKATAPRAAAPPNAKRGSSPHNPTIPAATTRPPTPTTPDQKATSTNRSLLPRLHTTPQMQLRPTTGDWAAKRLHPHQQATPALQAATLPETPKLEGLLILGVDCIEYEYCGVAVPTS